MGVVNIPPYMVTKPVQQIVKTFFFHEGTKHIDIDRHSVIITFNSESSLPYISSALQITGILSLAKCEYFYECSIASCFRFLSKYSQCLLLFKDVVRIINVFELMLCWAFVYLVYLDNFFIYSLSYFYL